MAVLEKGVATVRPIAIMSRSTWEEVYRNQVMEMAKQVGLGLLMYSADYDDIFPPLDQFNDGEVGPYMKDEFWRNFTFVLGGKAHASLRNPSVTVLGYMKGPGGYAVAFADGHVIWQVNKP